MLTLLCTVRGCGLPLDRLNGRYRCSNGHSFDVARSGYVNLLQPQDRRSSKPGDRKEAVDARRRLADAGYGAALSTRIAELIGSFGQRASVLDVGCGEGSHVGRVAAATGAEAAGVDLSAEAIELAARRYTALTWVVANADRGIPFADSSFDVIVSVTARRNRSEFARLIRNGGRLFIAVPSADDLAELRAAVQGEAREEPRLDNLLAELAPEFELESHEVIRERKELGRDELLDLLTATYRGMRHRERERAVAIERLAVTMSWTAATLRQRS